MRYAWRMPRLPRRRLQPLVAVLAMLTAPGAQAEVVDASPAGFTVRHAVNIAAPRAEVYRAAVQGVGSWWKDEFTVSGNADNLYLEALPQGCLCERLGAGSGIVHLTVTFVNPQVVLRLTGGLGPLGLLGVNGNLLWEFEDDGTGTTVTWSYAVGGYSPAGLDTLAPDVDRVLGDQLGRLKEFVENGNPG